MPCYHHLHKHGNIAIHFSNRTPSLFYLLKYALTPLQNAIDGILVLNPFLLHDQSGMFGASVTWSKHHRQQNGLNFAIILCKFDDKK